MPNELKFENSESLATTLAENIAQALHNAIIDNDQASLVVSGGKTPTLLFEKLSEQPIEWPRIWITLTDERCVDVTDADSNEALVRHHLLKNKAKDAHFVGLMHAHMTAEELEEAAERGIDAMRHPFDITLLGMGKDGHIASIFPHAPQLKEALDLNSGRLCMKTDPITAPHARLSLTLPALVSSRRIILLFTGEEKYAVYHRALQEDNDENLPVRALLQQHRAPVDVYWSH